MLSSPGPALSTNEELSDAQIVSHFESLGDNCEFGFLQRELGLEPLSLLRWAGIYLDGLLRAFMDDFDPGDALQITLDAKPAGAEYMVRVQPFGWLMHTFVHPEKQAVDKMLQDQTRRFRFLASKLIEDLEDGDKIFVFRRNEPVVDDSILALHDALNWYGPNTLLWVVEADGDNEPGSARWLQPGLIQGYVARLAPRSNGAFLSQSTWTQVCRSAYDLWSVRERQDRQSWKGSRLLERIVFGADGNAARYCRSGWGRQERNFAWGIATESTLTLPRPEPFAAYGLKVLVKPFRPDGVLKQRLSILVNGEPVKTFSATPEGMLCCHIAGTLIATHDTVEVTFACPGGLSLKEAKAGSDVRKLTVEFRELRLYGLS